MDAKTTLCPRCFQVYTGFPALSRRDNKTEVCSNCGTEEAMLDAQIPVNGLLNALIREQMFRRKLNLA